MSEVIQMPPRGTWGADLAANVRAELARAQVQQKRIQFEIGRSQAAVSARLRGETPWQVEELAIVAEVIGLTVADLLPKYAPRDSNPEPSDLESAEVGAGVVVDLAAYRAGVVA